MWGRGAAPRHPTVKALGVTGGGTQHFYLHEVLFLLLPLAKASDNGVPSQWGWKGATSHMEMKPAEGGSENCKQGIYTIW